MSSKLAFSATSLSVDQSSNSESCLAHSRLKVVFIHSHFEKRHWQDATDTHNFDNNFRLILSSGFKITWKYWSAKTLANQVIWVSFLRNCSPFFIIRVSKNALRWFFYWSFNKFMFRKKHVKNDEAYLLSNHSVYA